MKRKIEILSTLSVMLCLVISTPAPAAILIQYTYDDLNRLTTADQVDNIIHYTYDEIGNILTKTVINCIDADNDGYYSESGCGTDMDCDDSDINISQDATEICDGVDNNCDGTVDESPLKPDSINLVQGLSSTIPVRIGNSLNQIASLGFSVTYDSSVLVYTGYTRGDLTVNFDSFTVNSDTPGTVTISGSESGGDVIAAGASGVVVNLNFTAGEPSSPDQCIEIVITGFTDDISSWNACPGEECYDCPPDGDVNNDSKITPQDALIAFRHYLELITLGECQQAIADVNENGSVTPADALCIFQKYLELPSCLDE